MMRRIAKTLCFGKIKSTLAIVMSLFIRSSNESTRKSKHLPYNCTLKFPSRWSKVIFVQDSSALLDYNFILVQESVKN